MLFLVLLLVFSVNIYGEALFLNITDNSESQIVFLPNTSHKSTSEASISNSTLYPSFSSISYLNINSPNVTQYQSISSNSLPSVTTPISIPSETIPFNRIFSLITRGTTPLYTTPLKMAFQELPFSEITKHEVSTESTSPTKKPETTTETVDQRTALSKFSPPGSQPQEIPSTNTQPETPPPYAQPTMTPPPETEPPDTPSPETQPTETPPQTPLPKTQPTETPPPQTPSPKTQPTETPPTETPPPQTPPPETQPTETPPPETQPTETPPPETQPTETPPPETQPTETPPPETQPTETPPPETQPTETPPPDTQPTEISSPNISSPASSTPDTTNPQNTNPDITTTNSTIPDTTILNYTTIPVTTTPNYTTIPVTTTPNYTTAPDTTTLNYSTTPDTTTPDSTTINYTTSDFSVPNTDVTEATTSQTSHIPTTTDETTTSEFPASSGFPPPAEKDKSTAVLLGILIPVLIIGVIVILWMGYRSGRINWPPKYLSSDTPDNVRPSYIALKKLPAHCDQMLEVPSKLNNEFQFLKTLSDDIICRESFIAAQMPDNKVKNRYTNILPYDSTRVKLIPEGNDFFSDYINASYIKGYTNEIEYIATQGPKEETCRDFWRMIYQEPIKVIVMVTQCEEMGKPKCHKYFPNLRENMVLGDISIWCTTELHFPIYTSRTLVLTKDDRKRSITHIHFREWPDFGCPSTPDLMLQFCQVMRQHITIAQPGITVVHCSAGVGRTGTLIAVDILLQQINENKKISVFDTVYKLRKHRVSMVQSEAQYVYIYQCLKEALENPSYLASENSSSSSMEPIYENIECTRMSPTRKIPAEVVTVESEFAF